jgi:hypothetical protein
MHALFVVLLLSAAELQQPSELPAAADTLQNVWRVVVGELRERELGGPQWPRPEDLELFVASWTSDHRRLRVTSLCWDDRAQHIQLQLECGEVGTCLPFLVYVHADPSAAALARGRADSRLRSPLEACGIRTGARPHGKNLTGTVIRAGDRATAVFLAAGLRMAATVKCLERGSAGEVIRVRSQDGHIFRARILGPAQLEVVMQ